MTDSYLRWAVGDGFREYLSALPDNTLTCSDGCTETSAGFLFPFEPEAAPGEEVLRFGGAVQFTGHGGMLDVPIIRPWIEKRNGTLSLTVEEPGGRSRFPLLSLPDLVTDTRGGELRACVAAPTLSFEGTYLFGNVYRTGHLMGALSFDVAAHEYDPFHTNSSSGDRP